MVAKLKKDDKVIVITGKDKGKKGTILRVLKKTNKLLVEGINVAKRHQRATMTSAGGIVEKAMPIDASNVMLVDPKTGEATRVGVKEVSGKRVRFAKKSGEVIDN